MKYDLNIYNRGMEAIGQFLKKCYILNSWLPSNMEMEIQSNENKILFADNYFVYIEVKIIDDFHNESWVLRICPLDNQYKMFYYPFNMELLNGNEQAVMFHTNNELFFNNIDTWFQKWARLYDVELEVGAQSLNWDWYLETMVKVGKELKEWC